MENSFESSLIEHEMEVRNQTSGTQEFWNNFLQVLDVRETGPISRRSTINLGQRC